MSRVKVVLRRREEGEYATLRHSVRNHCLECAAWFAAEADRLEAEGKVHEPEVGDWYEGWGAGTHHGEHQVASLNTNLATFTDGLATGLKIIRDLRCYHFLRHEPLPLPPCPVCGRQPEAWVTRADVAVIACPGGLATTHRVIAYGMDPAEAEARWRDCFGGKT